MKKKYTLEQVERLAKDRSIVSIFVDFDPKHYKKSRSFTWEDRDKIRWDHVVRCRLDWKEPQWRINGNGDARICYGFRINPE
jgi:hypothetical protein